MGEKGGNRYIFRGIHEDLIDQMQQRVLNNPDITRKRKELVEHPFGTMKHWMDQGYFLMRAIEKVTGEMSLTALCYNIKRLLNIFNIKELIAKMQVLRNIIANIFFLLLKPNYLNPINLTYLSIVRIYNSKLNYSIGNP